MKNAVAECVGTVFCAPLLRSAGRHQSRLQHPEQKINLLLVAGEQTSRHLGYRLQPVCSVTVSLSVHACDNR